VGSTSDIFRTRISSKLHKIQIEKGGIGPTIAYAFDSQWKNMEFV
jgi:hypothetical protein